MATSRFRSRGRGPGLAGVVAALVAVATAAACTSTPAPTPSPSPTPELDERLARLVPEAVRTDGTLTIGTDPSYPPMEFTTPDGSEIQGVDVDLASAIATVLGLTPEFTEDAFTALSVAVRAGRVELGMSALTVRPRHRLTDAVLYYRSGSQLVSSSNSAPDLTPNTMCNQSIAVLEGSYQVVHLKRFSRACVRRGDSPITIEARSDQTQVTRATLSASVAGMLSDRPVALWTVREYPGRLDLAGATFARAPLGIIAAPELRRLTRAVRGALQQLIESGYYHQVLRTWSVSEGAVPSARIRWSFVHQRQRRGGQ